MDSESLNQRLTYSITKSLNTTGYTANFLTTTHCASLGVCTSPTGENVPIETLEALPITRTDLQQYARKVTQLTAQEEALVAQEEVRNNLKNLQERFLETLVQDRFNGDYGYDFTWEEWEEYFELYLSWLEFLDLSEFDFDFDFIEFDHFNDFTTFYQFYNFFLLLLTNEFVRAEFVRQLAEIEGVQQEVADVVERGIIVVDLDNDNSLGYSGNASQVFQASNPAQLVAITDGDVNISSIFILDVYIGATLQIIDYQSGHNESLFADTSGTDLFAFWDASSGLLSISGQTTQQTYEQVLATVTYQRTGASGAYSRGIDVTIITDEAGDGGAGPYFSALAKAYLTFTSSYFDLNTIATDSTDGRTFTTAVAGAELGYAVQMIGGHFFSHVNDYLLGAPQTNDANLGRYTRFGGGSWVPKGNIDMDGLYDGVSGSFLGVEYNSQSPDLLQTGFEAVGDNFGQYLGRFGDIDNDGTGDFGVAGPDYRGGDGYVSMLNRTSQQFILGDVGAGDGLGPMSNTAGDINNDTFDDILIGAPNQDDNGAESGSAYLIRGSQFGFIGGEYQLGVDTYDTLLEVRGQAANDNAGSSVGIVGDFNRDGYDDFIVGASGHDSGGGVGGAVYMLYGDALGSGIFAGGLGGSYNLVGVTNASQIYLPGAVGDGVGNAVSGIGDFDGDGYDDFVYGAQDANGGLGAVYIVYGQAGIGAPMVTTINAVAGNEDFGFSVSTAGDFNGDGFDDIIIGDPNADTVNGVDSGAAYIIYGGNSAASYNANDGSDIVKGNTYTLSQLTGVGNETEGLIINGKAAGDLLGYSVSGGGNPNGDNWDEILPRGEYFEDVLVGAPGVNGNQGEAYLVHGMGNEAASIMNLTASAPGEALVSSHAQDVLSDGGHNNVVFRSGGNDDTLKGSANFAILDGGTGIDTFELSSGDIDFSSINNNVITDIERIDLRADIDTNTLTISVSELFDMTDSNNQLTIFGDSNDVVIITDLADWTEGASYNYSTGIQMVQYTNGEAKLDVQEGVVVF